jgi:cyclase
MFRPLTRRRLLTGVAALAATRMLPAAAAEPLALQALGEDLWLVRGAAAPVVVADSGTSLLLVDGGEGRGARALRAFLARQFKGRRIATVVNTHWHWDRTGANELLAAEGASLVGHENTRLWMGTPIHSAWDGRVYAPHPPAARPNQTFFYGSKPVEFAGQTLQCVYLPQAHTDGDLYVYFPAQDVLVAGDVVSGRRVPQVDAATNGWLGGMLSGLKAVAARCGERTRIIGSEAEVLGRADVRAQQELCFDVLTRIGQSYYKGETWMQFQASAPMKEYEALPGDAPRFLRAAYDSAWHHVNEIRRPTRQEWIG